MGMTDLERVLQGLDCVSGFGHCLQSEAFAGGICAYCIKEIAKKAKELLKEQEAKTGTWQWKIHGRAESGGTLGEAICDQCGKSTYATAVKGDLNYCPNCGAKMTDRR